MTPPGGRQGHEEMDLTSASTRRVALDTALKAAAAILLAGASYTVRTLDGSGAIVIGLLILCLTLASLPVAVAAGSAAANLVSAKVAGKPHRPGRILSVNTDYDEPDFDPGMGPFSKTQTVLLTLIALTFVPFVLWLSLPLPTQIELGVFMWVPMGLMIGLGYRL